MTTNVEILVQPESWFISIPDVDAYIPRIKEVPTKIEVPTGAELNLFYSLSNRVKEIQIKDRDSDHVFYGVSVTFFEDEYSGGLLFDANDVRGNVVVYDCSLLSERKIGNVIYKK